MINFLKQLISNWLDYILIGITILGMFLLLIFNTPKKTTRSTNQQLLLEIAHQYNILQYWKYKDSIYMHVDKYIKNVAPHSNVDALYLITLCDEYNIDIRFVMSQAQLESHFGTRGMAARTNQMFNIGAYDNKNYEKINKVYKYENVNLSIEPYLRLLKSKYLINKNEKSLLNNYTDIYNKRYASDKTYEQKLTCIYNNINDSSFQHLLSKYSTFKNLIDTYETVYFSKNYSSIP